MPQFRATCRLHRVHALQLMVQLLRSMPDADMRTLSTGLACSVGMVHWPETVAVRVIQQACPRDRLLGIVDLRVPGGCGRPAVDPAPQVLSWEAQPQSSFEPSWRRRGGRCLILLDGLHAVDTVP